MTPGGSRNAGVNQRLNVAVTQDVSELLQTELKLHLVFMHKINTVT